MQLLFIFKGFHNLVLNISLNFANKLQSGFGLYGLILKVYVLALLIAYPNGGYLVTFS